MTLSITELGEKVREALGTGDLDAYQHLLAPDVKWGAPDTDSPEWGCHNRNQVLTWYRRAREAGAQAEVTEVVAGRDRLLVGLRVSGTGGADAGETLERWQVLTIRGGLVADIRGFDDRATASQRAGVTA